LIVDHAPTVCAISIGSILNATCDKYALKDRMSVDKHIGHCLFTHSANSGANCTETTLIYNVLKTFYIAKLARLKHGKLGRTYRNFVAVMIVELSHQLHLCAVLEKGPKYHFAASEKRCSMQVPGLYE
jgi:hypothetical protein